MKKHREQPKLLAVALASDARPLTHVMLLGKEPFGEAGDCGGGHRGHPPLGPCTRGTARQHHEPLPKGNSQNPSGCFLSQQEM